MYANSYIPLKLRYLFQRLVDVSHTIIQLIHKQVVKKNNMYKNNIASLIQ